MTRAPLVSIAMPCYRQLDLARRAIDSIRAQTFEDFELTLLDDGASDAYRDYVAHLGDPRVVYHRNPERLGAMRNMFGAIQSGRGRYTLAFHEDDLISRGYLAAAVHVLEQNPRVGFVAAEIREFNAEPGDGALAAEARQPAFDLYGSAPAFLRAILGGSEPMFGSVVYRRAALSGIQPEHERYATLLDRPFLLSILRHWSAAVLHDPLAWYRAPAAGDTRHQTMTADHIVHLFECYRAALPQPMSPQDRALFYTYSGHWLFRLYDLTPDVARPPFGTFLLRVWRDKLYQPKWRGRFGLRLLARAVMGSRTQPA
jgi:glycosyltransferase involved in cell wall biosynthesis